MGCNNPTVLYAQLFSREVWERGFIWLYGKLRNTTQGLHLFCVPQITSLLQVCDVNPLVPEKWHLKQIVK